MFVNSSKSMLLVKFDPNPYEETLFFYPTQATVHELCSDRRQFKLMHLSHVLYKARHHPIVYMLLHIRLTY